MADAAARLLGVERLDPLPLGAAEPFLTSPTRWSR